MADLSAAEFSTALLIFRVIFGFVFALHGWGKVRGGIGGTAGWFDSMGMKPGMLHAWAAAITEMGTGVMIMLGLLTPFAAAGMVGVMVVVAAMVVGVVEVSSAVISAWAWIELVTSSWTPFTYQPWESRTLTMSTSVVNSKS